MALTMMRRYLDGLRTSVRYNASAFGYSILITGSFGAIAVSEGRPARIEVLLFTVGAALAFSITEAAASNLFRDRGRGEPPEVVMLGSAMSVISISAALGTVLLLGTIMGSWVVWTVAPFTATIVYLFILGIELALAHRAEE